LKIIQLAAGLDEPSAGPSYSVRRLAHALVDLRAEVAVHTVLGWRGPPDDTITPVPERHRQDFAGAPILSQLCFSSDLREALRRQAPVADVIHAHGLWLMPNVYPGPICRRAGKPFVLSPRGMLGPEALAFSRRRKMAFWTLFQGQAAREAALIHVTSESEYDEVRAFGLTNPVAVIANGIDPPTQRAAARATGRTRTLLTLGRIHPKKGLTHLIEAWAAVAPAFPDWRLRIVGPDENGHAGELQAMALARAAERISIEPPAFGSAKIEAFREADLFVLPTLNENFALTVAEALAAELPAIVTKGAPWSGLESHGCGWWIDVGSAPLEQALRTAMANTPAALAAMGRAGRAWMEADFSWSGVASRMLSAYAWAAGRGERPAFVRID
jgi:glycosyltransferase involved in cell wall biosynthesis